MARIGFTGTQHGMTPHQMIRLQSIMQDWAPTMAAHGDCIGADAQFHSLMLQLRVPIYIYPPSDPKKRAFCTGAVLIAEPQDYLVRDRAIVDAVEVMIATPKTDVPEKRSGTWYTVRYSHKQNKPTFVILPDGRIAK
jgi:hypothetical protein